MQWLTKDDLFYTKVRDSQSPIMLSFPMLCLLVPHKGSALDLLGGLTVLCRPSTDFFMSLAWEKAFGHLQTQFETQKWWYDKVFGKNAAYGTHVCIIFFFSKFWFSGSLGGVKRAKNGRKWQKILPVSLCLSGTVHHIDWCGRDGHQTQ